MKTFLIFILPVILTISLAANGQDSPTPSREIEVLFDDVARQLIARQPEDATSLGISSAMGYRVDHHRLADRSFEAQADFYHMLRGFRLRLKKLKDLPMSPSQRLDADILEYSLNINLEGEPFANHYYVINPMFGVHNSLTNLMTHYHPLDSLPNARAYISRLRAYATRFNHLLQKLKVQEQRGIIPHEAVIQRLKQSMSRFINRPAMENPLYTTFDEGIKDLGISVDTRLKLLDGVEDAIQQVVYPSYRDFIARLERILRIADQRAGVWKLPDGEAFYRHSLKLNTGSDLSPEAIHQLGHKEVKRIQRHMKRLMKADGFNPALLRNQRRFGNVINGYWRFINTEKGRGLRYQYSEKGRQKVLKDTGQYLDGIMARLDRFFEVLPKTKLIVAPVPPYKTDTMGAHYSTPSLDGKRKGVFYINLSSPPFKPGLQTLALHEGVPGHHFQLAIQTESGKVRMFRRFLFFTAYIEGWALYAERLGREKHWFTGPESHIGSLNSELLRAARLVLDTGIHYKRWTRRQAIKYMADTLGWSSSTEIDRYSVWPGQACAYKMGELKILELRKAAKRKQRKNFDIKVFHQKILQHGSIPMPILEKLILGK